MYKKLLVLSLATFAISSAQAASGPEIKVNGGFEVQAGYLKNSGPLARKNYITGNSKGVGFNSSAHVIVDAHNTTDAGLEYGAKIALATAARNSRRAASSLYFISQAGKWELGSEKSAMAKMKITPYTNACGTGGGWDSWVRSDPADTSTPYATGFANFLDAKTRNSDYAEYSRKVTYYTPEFSGLQIGVSYIPDTTNVGYAASSAPEKHEPAKALGYNISIKNAFGGGVTYENKISDDMKFKLAVVGEMGKAVGRRKDEAPVTVPKDIKFKNLKGYTVGTQIDYKDVSLTGAYYDYMKSLTSAELDNWRSKNTNMYGFGARYNHPSKVSLSATYFTSKNKGNRLNATTIAAEYKAAPGILPYAEVTFYKTNGKYQSDKIIKADKNHGTAVVIGAKLEF